MMKATTYDRVMFWKMLHFGSSYLSIALIGIHIGIYCNFIMNIFKKVLKMNQSNNIGKMLANISMILVLIFGIYTTYKIDYFTKVTNTLTYVSIISVFAISTYYSDAAIKEYIKSKSNQDCNEKIIQEA